jgi:hypothetical protein
MNERIAGHLFIINSRSNSQLYEGTGSFSDLMRIARSGGTAPFRPDLAMVISGFPQDRISRFLRDALGDKRTE